MARKAPTFAQLIAYISRDAEPGAPIFARNLYHDGADPALTADGFLANYQHLPKRKNGNALYHEVIVLEPQGHLPPERVSEILLDLAERYCASRAPDQLAWGRIHANTDNPHIHLMLSANAARSSRRVRLDRKAFARIQADLERVKLQRFPELVGDRIYTKDPAERTMPKRSRAEGEATRRTGTPSQKQVLADRLRPMFEMVQSRADLMGELGRAGFDLYQRGKAFGVVEQASGKKHRLQTLGLAAAFDRLSEQASVKEPLTPAPRQPNPPHPSREEPRPSAAPDPRATDLIAAREALEQAARDRLDGFEADHPNSHEDFER